MIKRKNVVIVSRATDDSAYSYFTGGSNFYALIEDGRVKNHEIFLIPSCSNGPTMESDGNFHFTLPKTLKGIDGLIEHLQEVVEGIKEFQNKSQT